jgi:hypothetical protein
MTSCASITKTRTHLQRHIAKRGGAYIRPEDNHQPNPALRIASIRLDGIQAIGQTEAQAQANWFKQKEEAPQ